jgi:S-ribosylhomocysteine lyase
MEKITSFTINHLKLLTGLYVSRKDKIGSQTVTTFDLRMTRPYKETVMDTAGIHAIEHLGATYLRNDKFWKDKTVYFGPMGCRTGFYMVLAGDLETDEVKTLIKNMFEFIADYQGDVPGATEKDCGNCHDMSLENAKKYAKKYLSEVFEYEDKSRFTYPSN